MKELKPFGDVPNKLSLQLKRSFVATRTFSQALTISANIASNMQNVSLKKNDNSLLNSIIYYNFFRIDNLARE
jgi:glypican 4 (K-glypican)